MWRYNYNATQSNIVLISTVSSWFVQFGNFLYRLVIFRKSTVLYTGFEPFRFVVSKIPFGQMRAWIGTWMRSSRRIFIFWWTSPNNLHPTHAKLYNQSQTVQIDPKLYKSQNFGKIQVDTARYRHHPSRLSEFHDTRSRQGCAIDPAPHLFFRWISSCLTCRKVN